MNDVKTITKFDVPASIYTIPIVNAAELKPKILEALDEVGLFSATKLPQQQISNTDWYIGDRYGDTKYWGLVWPSIERVMNMFCEEAGYAFWTIDQRWFQQYKTGDFHGWHTHTHTTHNAVFFVELPNQQASTMFKHNGEEFRCTVNEGDVLIFPSYLAHCSPPVVGPDRKTVIVCNLNVGAKP